MAGKLAVFFMLTISAWATEARAQEEQPATFEFKGYLKYLTTVNIKELDEEWVTDNLLHNRLEFRYFPSEKWKVDLEMRNRLFFGQAVTMYNQADTLFGYDYFIGQDNGFFDMSFNWASGDSYLLNTTIDRFYLDYTTGKFQVRAGRHRINWGQNFVWNPNDVFNAYSYFDFDYEERPGTDAVRLQYFTNTTASGEFVYQMGETIDDMSFMGLYRFSKWQYDIQFLAGQVKTDLVLGTGWSGDIKGGGFRGEISYFHNKDSLSSPVGQLVAALSGDYTFHNSTYVHMAFIYNSKGATKAPGFINPTIIRETSAKYLTLSRLNLFGQVSYPLSPLWRADVASIVNPFDKSFFISPAVSYSLADNLELFMIAQIFSGDSGTEYGGIGTLFYLRMKWSF